MTQHSHRWLARAAAQHRRSLRYRLWMVVLAGISVALAATPLFNTLGFGFCLAIALVVSLASFDLSVAWIATWRTQPAAHLERTPPLGATIGRTFRVAITHNAALLIAPAVVMIANGSRVQNCDWGFGLLAYFAMPAVSMVYATLFGLAIGCLVSKKKWLRRGSALAFVLVSLAISVVHFYRSPAVFSYNPLVGYFPGNLYDERIELTSAFYWARAFHLCIALAAACAVSALLDVPRVQLRSRTRRANPIATKTRRSFAFAASVFTVCAAVLWSRSAALGFSTVATDIGEFLPGRYETKHFLIHYPVGGAIERDIADIARDHEFRLAQVEATLGVKATGRITSFYFKSPNDKFKFMGLRDVYMAKPWRNEIYLNHRGFPHPTLRHELVHAVAAKFGDPIFGVSARRIAGLPLVFNPGFIEGLAVAAAWPDHAVSDLTPHESVHALYALNLAPPPTRVFSTGFLAMSSARSYTLSGSVVRYLLDTEGTDAVRRLYRSGGDFKAVLGRSERQVLTEWKAMIAGLKLPTGGAAAVQERFRRKSVFRRPCAHHVARTRQKARQAVGRGEPDRAVELWQTVCDQVPGEPSYKLELARQLERAGRESDAESIYRAIGYERPDVSASLQGRALVKLAELSASRSAWPEAKQHLSRASDLSLDRGARRLVEAELFALAVAGPAGTALRNYFWPGKASDLGGAVRIVRAAFAGQAAMHAPNNGFARYLLGRNLHDAGMHAPASKELQRALTLGLPHRLLRVECARLLAASSFLAGDFDVTRFAASELREGSGTTVDELVGDDWLERVSWAASSTAN